VSTAAAYLAVAFVLLQLGEILFPAVDLGPGALRVLFALLLALFPIVLALSWVYDVTSSGFRKTQDAGGTESGPRPALLAGVLVAALGLAWAGWYGVQTVDTGGVAVGQTSIGVLPFTDLCEARDQA
jgi:hypothetical protein